MRIVIDFQGAQTGGSRNRGIGRYSTSFVKALLRNARGHEIHLALNGAFAETIQPIRDEFADLLPQDRIHVWKGISPVDQLNIGNVRRRRAAEECRLAFLESLRPDIVHVTSLFEGLTDDAVVSIDRCTFATSVSLYDLIPYLNADSYLAEPTVASWYHNKLGHLRRADLLLSISESSRQEAVEALGFDPDRVTNVGTAADEQFCSRNISGERRAELYVAHGIDRPFIMYTGGIDVRKNIEALIEAYSRLSKAVRSRAQLAIVCSVRDADRELLQSLAKSFGVHDLIMTGFVPEEDLIDLYNLSELFVFPSWHEGFGLPALEAMWCDAMVIGSDRSSIPEVIGLRSALFDPRSIEDIAAAIERGLTDEAFRGQLLDNARVQRRRFSWDRTAETSLAAFADLHNRFNERRNLGRPTRKPTLACISPIPPARSGIADYVSELLPELSRFYDITMVVADDVDIALTADPFISGSLDVISTKSFKERFGDFDRVVYHLGNSDHHDHMFALAENFPGIVDLHDFYLSGILHWMQDHLNVGEVWDENLYLSHGYPALADARSADPEGAIYKYPASLAVIDRFIGVVVHSEHSRYLAKRFSRGSSGSRWAVVEHGRRQIFNPRSDGSLSDNQGFRLCSFGIMGRTKASDRLIRCWSKSKFVHDPHSELIFVGARDGGKFGEDVDGLIDELGLKGRVTITGWLDGAAFLDELKKANGAVQLRGLSRGEASGTVLDCLACGIPTIVNANGAMAELPRDSVILLDDNFRDRDLIEALNQLHDDPSLRRKLSEAGQRAIRTRYSPRRSARLYAEAIENFYAAWRTNSLSLARQINDIPGPDFGAVDKSMIASAIAVATRPSSQQVAYLDVTDRLTHQGDIFRNPLEQNRIRRLLETQSTSRIETIRWCAEDRTWRFARLATLSLLEIDAPTINDEPVLFAHGGTLLTLDAGPSRAEPIDELKKIHALEEVELVESVPKPVDDDVLKSLEGALALAGLSANRPGRNERINRQLVRGD